MRPILCIFLTFSSFWKRWRYIWAESAAAAATSGQSNVWKSSYAFYQHRQRIWYAKFRIGSNLRLNFLQARSVTVRAQLVPLRSVLRNLPQGLARSVAEQVPLDLEAHSDKMPVPARRRRVHLGRAVLEQVPLAVVLGYLVRTRLQELLEIPRLHPQVSLFFSCTLMLNQDISQMSQCLLSLREPLIHPGLPLAIRTKTARHCAIIRLFLLCRRTEGRLWRLGNLLCDEICTEDALLCLGTSVPRLCAITQDCQYWWRLWSKRIRRKPSYATRRFRLVWLTAAEPADFSLWHYAQCWR